MTGIQVRMSGIQVSSRYSTVELGRKMTELARPVGIGFAGRGKVSDVAGWAEDARLDGHRLCSLSAG